jgi:hypothetical protein
MAHPLPTARADMEGRLPSPEDDERCINDLLHCDVVHPPQEKPYPELSPSQRTGFALAGIFLTFALIMLGIRYQFKFLKLWLGLILPGILLIILFCCLAFAWHPVAKFLTHGLKSFPETGATAGLGEPIFLIEGNSLWPPIFLRAASTLLAFGLIITTYILVGENMQKTFWTMAIPKEFYAKGRHIYHIRTLLDSSRRLRRRQLYSRFRRVYRSTPVRWLRRFYNLFWPLEPPPPIPTADDPQPDAVPAQQTVRFTSWLRAALTWRPAGAPPKIEGPDRPFIPIGPVLARYTHCGRWQARALRAAVATLAAMGLGFVLCEVLGWPVTPARSELALKAYGIFTLTDVCTTFFLVFTIVDANIYACTFIRYLTKVQSSWPPETQRRFSEELSMWSADLDDWMDLQFLARRSGNLSSLIYFPFITLAILTTTRSILFAAFPFNIPIVAIQVICIGIVALSVFALRQAAEAARAAAREQVLMRLISANRRDSVRAAQLERLLEMVDNLRIGAFAPWSSQPLVKAFLLPLLTYGGTTLLQVYALPGG